MFKRKTPEDEIGIRTPQGEPSSPQAAFTPASKPSAKPAGVEGADKPASPTPLKPAPIAPVRPVAEVLRRGAEGANGARKSEPQTQQESKKLIVGRDISLNGKISSCDRLIVEGRVEAELHNCHTIEIAEAGTFRGAAEIEGAEISGHYEGSLTVRDSLLIRRTGRVSGTIRYGRIEIERGGEINGDVKSLETKGELPLHGERSETPAPIPSPAVTAAATRIDEHGERIGAKL